MQLLAYRIILLLIILVWEQYHLERQFLKGISLTVWIGLTRYGMLMDPEELRSLIDGSRIIHQARGCEKRPVEAEAPTIAFAFASVVAIKDLNLVMF